MSAILKTLGKALLGRKFLIWVLVWLTDKTKYEFDDELVELGVALYDDDKEAIIQNAKDLIEAIQRDLA